MMRYVLIVMLTLKNPGQFRLIFGFALSFAESPNDEYKTKKYN